jgi:hypothetical protein
MGISKIDTRANWAALNPTLLPGETGFESDTGNEKVGNGKSTWNKLEYFGSPGYWGDFADETDQAAAAIDTPYEVKFRLADVNNHGVKIVDDSKITVEYPGVYTFVFMLQLTNNDTQIHDVNIWLRKNNAGSAGDIAMTDSRISVIESHGGVPGHTNGGICHTLRLAKNDFIQLMWATSDTNILLDSSPAITSPYTRPGSPSAGCTVCQIAAA